MLQFGQAKLMNVDSPGDVFGLGGVGLGGVGLGEVFLLDLYLIFPLTRFLSLRLIITVLIMMIIIASKTNAILSIHSPNIVF